MVQPYEGTSSNACKSLSNRVDVPSALGEVNPSGKTELCWSKISKLKMKGTLPIEEDTNIIMEVSDGEGDEDVREVNKQTLTLTEGLRPGVARISPLSTGTQNISRYVDKGKSMLIKNEVNPMQKRVSGGSSFIRPFSPTAPVRIC